jgi:hypothetical protein
VFLPERRTMQQVGIPPENQWSRWPGLTYQLPVQCWELGPKLIPRNAFFSVLIEAYDPPVEFGSVGIGHRDILVVEALPERLDQVEPLARRKPSEFRR